MSQIVIVTAKDDPDWKYRYIIDYPIIKEVYRFHTDGREIKMRHTKFNTPLKEYEDRKGFHIKLRGFDHYGKAYRPS